jgi:1-acyl-sn-glycerol-3-phosphate acyltransferase
MKSGTIANSQPRAEAAFELRGVAGGSAAGGRRSEIFNRVPVVSRPLLHWFTWYSRRYLRRHFHSVRVSRAGLPPVSKLPLVICSNHASWWDALVCVVLKDEFFPDRTAFAPMDATMLERYKMFGRMGFFGVEPRTRRGAIQFLRTAEAILQSPGHLLAVTPQGRFADVRERPVHFEAGLGHLAGRVQRALFVPLAVEYVFWEERLPEILVRFGEPVEVRGEDRVAFPPPDWTRLFEEKLSATQDALAAESRRRDPGDFQRILRGGAGQGGIYDWWRSLTAKLRGEPFNREHGRK